MIPPDDFNPSIFSEEAPSIGRDELDTCAALREGLADAAAGRTKSLDEFERDFRQRHAIEGKT